MKIEKPFPIPSHRSAAQRIATHIPWNSIRYLYLYCYLFMYVFFFRSFGCAIKSSEITSSRSNNERTTMNKRTNENSGKHSNKIKHRKQFSYDCRSKQSNFSIKKIQHFSSAKIFRRTNLLQLRYLNVFLLRLHNLLHPNSIFELFLRFDFFQKQIEFILGK